MGSDMKIKGDSRLHIGAKGKLVTNRGDVNGKVVGKVVKRGGRPARIAIPSTGRGRGEQVTHAELRKVFGEIQREQGIRPLVSFRELGWTQPRVAKALNRFEKQNPANAPIMRAFLRGLG